MIVTKEEFLKTISEKERTYYEENFHYLEQKAIREGRLIAFIADNLLEIIKANGESTPDLLVQTYKTINEHFDREIHFLKQRREKLLQNRDA